MNALENLHGVWTPPIISAGEQALSVWQEQGYHYLLETEFAINELETAEGRRLFRDLLDSEEYDYGMKKLLEVLKKRPEAARRFNDRLAGFIYEVLCYNFLKSQINKQGVLLSPRETIDLYSLAYPEKPVLDGLNLGIAGITVPDGVIVAKRNKNSCIVGVCEYSLTRSNSYPSKQAQSKYYDKYHGAIDDLVASGLLLRDAYLSRALGEYIHGRYPQLPPTIVADYKNLRTLYLYPREEGDFTSRRREQILFMPFSRGEFGEVITGIFNDAKVAVETA